MLLPAGLRWHDDDPRATLEEKIRRGATRFDQKYGRKPNRVWVHTSATKPPSQVDGIVVGKNKTVHPNYFHFAYEEPKKKEAT